VLQRDEATAEQNPSRNGGDPVCKSDCTRGLRK